MGSNKVYLANQSLREELIRCVNLLWPLVKKGLLAKQPAMVAKLVGDKDFWLADVSKKSAIELLDIEAQLIAILEKLLDSDGEPHRHGEASCCKRKERLDAIKASSSDQASAGDETSPRVSDAINSCVVTRYEPTGRSEKMETLRKKSSPDFRIDWETGCGVDLSTPDGKE